MSSARRAYDLIRGYVNHGWEQVAPGDEKDAQDELRQAIESPQAGASQSGSNLIHSTSSPEAVMTLETARKLFDLSAAATSQQITEAYDALRLTADPAKFAEGSDSWRRAKLLARRLDSARNILMENIDPTVRRFERLEIE